MKRSTVNLIFFWVLPFISYAQEPTKDSLNIWNEQLNPVILTGQYSPQSVDKSVVEVDVITQSDIKKMAGNTLGDVLNQTLNLTIIPNAGEGRSGIEQFGFNSEYIKILVDGIPIVGDEGFGNTIDISQINLDDIQQIEIVEGAMGVQYGSNAVTGVINIITNKKSQYKWQITPYIQEETIGREYKWFDQGRHIQSIKIGHNFSNHWYADLTYTRNNFKGFLDQQKGKDYYNPTNENDGLRGYQWLPKIQNTLKGMVHYNGSRHTVFYKFEYFDELTDKYAQNVHLNLNPATQTLHPTANDFVFKTQRLYHHFNSSGQIFNQVHYNLSLSYQEQIRNQESFTYHLQTQSKSNIERGDYNTRKGFFSRGTFSHFFNTPILQMSVGYEINLDNGSASGLSEQNTISDSQNKNINTFNSFISAEIKPGKKLSLQPGFRYIHSSAFKDQIALSFSGKYSFKNDYQLRAIVGTSPKTPNFEQLYFYMVDSNHDVRGNKNLSPEKGKSIFIHFKKPFFFKSHSITYEPKLSAWYLDVEDKIDLIIVNNSPLSYQYNNIDLYQTWGLAFRNKFLYKNMTFNLGVSFSGESKVLNSSEINNDNYLYSLQVNTQFSYHIPNWDTTLSTYFKYNGPQYQFVQHLDTNAEQIISKEKQEGYGWLDASVRKSFFNNNLEITLGARNILNIKNITTSQSNTTGHTAANNQLLLGYGSSYFLKLLYNINF